MIKLPLLNENIELLEKVCDAFDLQPRGSAGEHSAVVGDMFDVSNKQRIGFSEVQLVQKMIDGITKIIAIEEKLAGGATAADIEASLGAAPAEEEVDPVAAADAPSSAPPREELPAEVAPPPLRKGSTLVGAQATDLCAAEAARARADKAKKGDIWEQGKAAGAAGAAAAAVSGAGAAGGSGKGKKRMNGRDGHKKKQEQLFAELISAGLRMEDFGVTDTDGAAADLAKLKKMCIRARAIFRGHSMELVFVNNSNAVGMAKVLEYVFRCSAARDAEADLQGGQLLRVHASGGRHPAGDAHVGEGLPGGATLAQVGTYAEFSDICAIVEAGKAPIDPKAQTFLLNIVIIMVQWGYLRGKRERSEERMNESHTRAVSLRRVETVRRNGRFVFLWPMECGRVGTAGRAEALLAVKVLCPGITFSDSVSNWWTKGTLLSCLAICLAKKQPATLSVDDAKAAGMEEAKKAYRDEEILRGANVAGRRSGLGCALAEYDAGTFDERQACALAQRELDEDEATRAFIGVECGMEDPQVRTDVWDNGFGIVGFSLTASGQDLAASCRMWNGQDTVRAGDAGEMVSFLDSPAVESLDYKKASLCAQGCVLNTRASVLDVLKILRCVVPQPKLPPQQQPQQRRRSAANIKKRKRKSGKHTSDSDSALSGDSDSDSSAASGSSPQSAVAPSRRSSRGGGAKAVSYTYSSGSEESELSSSGE
jgi:hypothetical protein